MRKTLLRLGWPLLAAGLTVALSPDQPACAAPTAPDQEQAQGVPADLGPIEAINLRAKRARPAAGLPGQQEDVAGLVASLLGIVGTYPIPPALQARFQDRLTQAELAFRAGRHKAINEAALVKALNNAALSLSLPDYARTSVAQVRFLRVAMRPRLPHLIGKAATATGHDGAQTLSRPLTTAMSPAEAACVALNLALQKMVNPFHQTTTAEWVARQQERARAHATPAALEDFLRAQPKGLTALPGDGRSNEMGVRLRRGAGAMSTAAQVRRLDAFLDDLGIGAPPQ